MGPLRNSDGSAEWKAGKAPKALRLVCSVNGPLEVKIRDELPQQATLEVVYRRNIGVPMIRERLIQEKLHTCLLSILRRDLLPRSLVQVVVQLIEGDIALEAEVSEGINVMSCALLDAGVPLSGLVAAASYGVDPSGKIIRLEDGPIDPESKHAVAYRYAGDEAPQLVLCESIGQFSEAQLLEVLQQAEQDTHSVYLQIRASASG